MRHINIILILSIFLSFSPIAYPANSPNLLLFIVIDGLPSETLNDFIKKNPDSALADLRSKSAFFPKAYHASSVTMTAPGHTNLSSGNYAWRHGIVNNWLPNPETMEVESIFSDVDYPLLNSQDRTDSKPGGLSPLKILTPTLSDFIKAKYPQSNIFSISAKSRAAIPLAGKSGIAFFYDDTVRNFTTSTYYLKEYPKWWQSFMEEINTIEKPSPDDKDFLATQLAKKIIQEYWMGFRDDTTDALLISFSSLDKSHHRFGLGSTEADLSLKRIDKYIGEILQAAYAMRGRESVLIALTSDHGFLKQTSKTQYFYGEQTEDKISQRFKQEEKTEVRSKWVAPYFYLHRSTGGQLKSAIQIAQEYFSSEPLVKTTHTWQTILRNTSGVFDHDWINIRHSYHPQRSGSLYVIQTENTVMKRKADDDISSHGTGYSYDTTVPLLLIGNLIPHHSDDRAVSVTGVLPTLLHYLNVDTEEEFDSKVIRFKKSLSEPNQINTPNQN